MWVVLAAVHGMQGASGVAHATEDHSPTGQPTITGLLEEGQLMRLDTSAIADQNGLTAVRESGDWSGLWIRVSANGTHLWPVAADTSAFRLSGDDVGSRFKVYVFFDDDAGNRHWLVSELSAIVQSASKPLITLREQRTTRVQPKEGDDLVFQLHRTGARSEALTVAVAVTESGSMVQTRPSSVTFAEGAATASLVVATEDDEVDEPLSNVRARVLDRSPYGLAFPNQDRVAVADDDTAALVMDATPVSVPAGGAASYTVALGAEPESTTRVSAVVSGTGLSIHPESLTFTTSNWASAQTFTVSAGEDSGNGDVGGMVTHKVRDFSLLMFFGLDPEVSVQRTVTILQAEESSTETERAASNAEPVGLPVISGTARIGELLTSSVSGITDADGLTAATFSYQWVANDGAADADIATATEATYRLTSRRRTRPSRCGSCLPMTVARRKR